MKYTLQNDNLKVGISDMGAELVSVFNKKNDTEYLWQPNPEYWTRQSPVLFPVCGRFFDLKYIYKDKTYPLGCHGFARKSEFSVIEKSDKKITLELTDNESTFDVYPFHFSFRITYEILNNCVSCTYFVKNTGDNKMYFSLGAHPGFNIPLSSDEKFEDYYIDFGREVSPEIIHNFHDNSGFEPYNLADGKTISLKHSLFDEDGIFLRNVKSGFAALRSKKSPYAVEVFFEDFSFVGFWHKPLSDASYVCVEPWYSLPCSNGKVPDIEKNVDMISLESNETYTIGYKFKIY